LYSCVLFLQQSFERVLGFAHIQICLESITTLTSRKNKSKQQQRFHMQNQTIYSSRSDSTTSANFLDFEYRDVVGIESPTQSSEGQAYLLYPWKCQYYMKQPSPNFNVSEDLHNEATQRGSICTRQNFEAKLLCSYLESPIRTVVPFPRLLSATLLAYHSFGFAMSANQRTNNNQHAHGLASIAVLPVGLAARTCVCKREFAPSQIRIFPLRAVKTITSRGVGITMESE